jgi:hypothetical protein
LKRRSCREVIEGYVQFDRGETAAVMLEPLPFGQVLRIEDPFPVLVAETAASNDDI